MLMHLGSAAEVILPEVCAMYVCIKKFCHRGMCVKRRFQFHARTIASDTTSQSGKYGLLKTDYASDHMKPFRELR